MKLSTRAALYSACIFPGAGLWLLGERRRAAVFVVPALATVIYLFAAAWRIAHSIADKLAQDIIATGGIRINVSEILAAVHQAIAASPQLETAQWIFIASWLLSIVSSYSVGRLREAATQ